MINNFVSGSLVEQSARSQYKYQKVPNSQSGFNNNMESTYGDSDIAQNFNFNQEINYDRISLQVVVLIVIQIQKLYQKRFNRRGYLKKKAQQKYEKFQAVVQNYQKNILGTSLLKCEKMIDNFIQKGKIQNEYLSQEIITILKDCIRKIQYIEERVLPKEFQGHSYDRDEEGFSDYDDLGLLGSSMLNFFDKDVIKEEFEEEHSAILLEQMEMNKQFQQMLEEQPDNHLLKDFQETMQKKTLAQIFLEKFNKNQEQLHKISSVVDNQELSKIKSANSPESNNKNALITDQPNPIRAAFLKKIEQQRQIEQEKSQQAFKDRIRDSLMKKYGPAIVGGQQAEVQRFQIEIQDVNNKPNEHPMNINLEPIIQGNNLKSMLSRGIMQKYQQFKRGDFTENVSNLIPDKSLQSQDLLNQRLQQRMYQQIPSARSRSAYQRILSKEDNISVTSKQLSSKPQFYQSPQPIRSHENNSLYDAASSSIQLMNQDKKYSLQISPPQSNLTRSQHQRMSYANKNYGSLSKAGSAMIITKEEGYLHMRAKVSQKRREENLFKEMNHFANIRPQSQLF
ncbi:UNKNOWN [Stylonychia lemnae]|uniref:Uncharacterized protein n=1 Tax=Stylonychia lemnae TaxID=5949 RepID=A0A078A1H8_STYLE|nr:UNKNOWN [Stylonychia lemnae]|eukprot:CDW75960.1 UNKNOWN [Stylonychia lemnae]